MKNTLQSVDAEGNITPAASQCGHKFRIPECPYEQCAARELYEALVRSGEESSCTEIALKHARGER